MSKSIEEIKDELGYIVNCFFVNEMVMVEERYDSLIRFIKKIEEVNEYLMSDDDILSEEMFKVILSLENRFEDFMNSSYGDFYDRYSLNEVEDEVMLNIGYKKNKNGDFIKYLDSEGENVKEKEVVNIEENIKNVMSRFGLNVKVKRKS